MKENNNIDKLFKEKLSTGNFAYQQGYWNDAEKLITTQSTKAGGFLGLGKKAIWLIAIPIALGIGALAWLMASPEAKQDTPALPEQTITNTNVPENTVPNNESGNKAVATPVVSNESSIIESTNAEAEITNAEKTPILNPSSKKESKPQKIAGQANDESNTTTAVLSNGVTELDEAQNAAETSTPAAQTTPSFAKSDDSAPDTFKTGSEITGEPANESDEPAIIPAEAPESSSQAVDEETFIANNDDNSASSINNEAQTLLADKDMRDEEAPIILPHQKNKKWLISAGIDYSYFFTSRTLSGDGTTTDYIDFRNTHEAAQSITSLGASILLERNNWLLSTGVYQTSINEDINYPGTLNVLTGVDNGQWNVQEIWNYSVDSNWVILGINQGGWNYDTTWTRTFDSTYIAQWDSIYTEKEDPEVAVNNGRHSMSYIEIPLLAGRSFGGEKLRFEIQAGGALGILTGTEGSIYINSRLDGLVHQNNHQTQFREWQFNVLLRAGIRYDITPQIQATLFPTLRYSLTNALKSDAIKQRYLGYGINLGVSYRF